jgi:putative oxidoreductase
MNESTAYDPQASAERPGKGLNIALWCVQVLLALAFLGASSGKLLGKPEMVGLFDAIGIGQWFRYVTGLLELAGAVLIVVPKTRSIGAGVLSGVMVGAIATHLFVLHNAPTAPLVLLLLAGFVVWGRRQELVRMVRSLSGAPEQRGTSR